MAPRFTWLAFVTTSVTTSGAMKCPGSPSWVHASAQVEAMADGTCQDVIEEIQARVAGWHDPHNGGQYSLLQEDALYLDIKRVTGNKRFTDKLTFTFSDFPGAKPACGIHACSESQVFSLKDFSTNYCNVRNLYCGKEDGCVPVKHNLSVSEVKLTPSRFAGTDKDACIVKNAEVEISMLRQSPALLGATVDDTLACISSCPLDDSTLQPSPLCVLESCTSNLAKCLFSSSCRDGVMCEMKCTEPLAKTEEAVHFAGLMECMRVHCPGFPPKKSCAALHCSVEAASCAVHSKCRHTLECADKCVPDKYTAALTATDLPMPQEAVVKTSMLRQSPALLGATVDDTLACISSCPLDDSTLQPSPLCVLESCTSNLAKCLFSSSCRDGVMCEMKCTEPLAKTEEAVHFAGLMECMRVHCPGFPPKKSCAALHCSVEAASCAVHSKC